MTIRGGRTEDPNGLPLMLGDSRTASNNFGLSGTTFANIPKNKFLFWMKFYRPESTGGTNWERGIGLMVKNMDRPQISFQQQTLNQYNRKRVIQTGHEFQPLQVKFHDSVGQDLRNMFIEYYQYYYGDSKIYGTGSVGSVIYDVVTGEPYEMGQFGFLPPLEDQNYGYFFSHISVYQFYNGLMERFDLINPKIASYNPDDFDYSSGTVTNEIAMSFDFEGIVYSAPEPITEEVANDAGLSFGQYWDVPNDFPSVDFTPGLASGPNAITSDPGQIINDVLERNIISGITGRGFGSVEGILGEISGAYDANRGLAVGKTVARSLRNIVSGNGRQARQGVQGILQGVLRGRPGGFL